MGAIMIEMGGWSKCDMELCRQAYNLFQNANVKKSIEQVL